MKMIIDQLPTVSLPVQDTDEMPIERGTQTYKVKVSDSFIKKTGGTVSGDLTVETGYFPQVTQKNTAADSSKTDGTGTGTWAIIHKDKNDNIVGQVQTTFDSSGKAILGLTARRIINNSPVANGLSLSVENDGTRTVSVSEPAAWREALALGTVITGTNAASLVVAKNTYITVSTISLPKGTWVVCAGHTWTTSFTELCIAELYNVGGTGIPGAIIRYGGVGGGGGVNLTTIVELSAALTVGLRVYQTSSESRTASNVTLKAVRIS